MIVNYTVQCLPEYESPEGQFEDKETVAFVRDLAEQTEWGWCMVKVTGHINDLDLSQSKYLGGCSYKSQEDFESSGYFDDMKAEIARGLTEKIRKIKEYEGI